MHGLEHWLGLVRAWIIIGLFVYCVWSLLDVLRDRASDTIRGILESG